MIFVSSSCVNHRSIADSVREIASAGFRNIELSGGTSYYDGYERDLKALQKEFGLRYLLHNYFPPPKEDFILNLASLDDDIYGRSMAHYERAIRLSRELGADRFGLHAGFFLDFSTKEIGCEIKRVSLFDRERSIARFCEGFTDLQNKASGLDLYIENNVLSKVNMQNFGGEVPFMLLDSRGYEELRSRIKFKLLLDVAHLAVSAVSLGHELVDELAVLLPQSDYVHLSDNNGLADQNMGFKEDSTILAALKRTPHFEGKVLTLEIRGGLDVIRASGEIVRRALGLAA